MPMFYMMVGLPGSGKSFTAESIPKVVYDYTYHNFFCQDGLTWKESQVGNWLQPVFKDGKLLRVYTLDEVRKNLHEGNF